MEVQKLKPVIKPETWEYIEEFFREIPEAFESVPIIQRTIFDNIQQARTEAHEEGILQGHAVGIVQGRKEIQKLLIYGLIKFSMHVFWTN